ncbi:hypothetical protein Bbelb_099550 [Branchiostoma belcheri]|nr:hypothetical protein Bbelb_099550 [Branchiostoma belcheri]
MSNEEGGIDCGGNATKPAWFGSATIHIARSAVASPDGFTVAECACHISPLSATSELAAGVRRATEIFDNEIPNKIKEAGFRGSHFRRSEQDTRSGISLPQIRKIESVWTGGGCDVNSNAQNSDVCSKLRRPLPLARRPCALDPTHRAFGKNWIITLKVKKPYSKRLKLKLSGVHVTRRASL